MFDPLTEANGIPCSNAVRMDRRLTEEAQKAKTYKLTSAGISNALRQVERQLGKVLQIPESAWVGSRVYHRVAGPRYSGNWTLIGQSVEIERREDGWWLIAIHREDEMGCGPQWKAYTKVTVSDAGKREIPDFDRPPVNVIDWD